VVIDFEATCEEKNPIGYPHEIIEFPAVLVSSGYNEDTKSYKSPEIIGAFHSFVRPVINPELSEFCKNLTGIEQVCFSISLKKVLKMLKTNV
jgi:inhibitor of KinA sporulation pathway (predicted exonuclease)